MDASDISRSRHYRPHALPGSMFMAIGAAFFIPCITVGILGVTLGIPDMGLCFLGSALSVGWIGILGGAGSLSTRFAFHDAKLRKYGFNHPFCIDLASIRQWKIVDDWESRYLTFTAGDRKYFVLDSEVAVPGFDLFVEDFRARLNAAQDQVNGHYEAAK